MHSRTLLLPVLLLLAGCNSGGTPAPGSGQASTNQHKPVIGVTLLTFDNPFFTTISDNLKAEADKHGFEVVSLSADHDAAKQSHQVKDFIVQKVSAIVLSPCDSKVIVPIIQEANAAGIPVFTVDIPCREPGVKIACQIATDNKSGGKEAAKAVIEALGGKPAKVAIVDYKQAESCILRVEGFKEAVAEHNTANAAAKLDIVAELDGGGEKDKGFKVGEDLLQRHPDLGAVFCINDPSALGVVAALERAGKQDQIVIVGFDGQPEGKQAIKDGKIYADPIQFPERMGIEVVQKIVAHSKGEDIEPEVLIPTELYRKADGEKDPSLK
jgi:ribose transport system substrate-binding protein